MSPFHRRVNWLTEKLVGLLVITQRVRSRVREVSGEQPRASSQASVDGTAEGGREQEEEEAEGWQKNQGTVFNFLTCAWHSSTLLRVMAMLRTPRDKYIRALPRKRLK